MLISASLTLGAILARSCRLELRAHLLLLMRVLLIFRIPPPALIRPFVVQTDFRYDLARMRAPLSSHTRGIAFALGENRFVNGTDERGVA